MPEAIDTDVDQDTFAQGFSDARPGLRTVIDAIKSAPFPMFVLIGVKRTLIYNAAYAPILGPHHPSAEGKPFFDVWPEVRGTVGHVIDQAFDGVASRFEDLPVTLNRPHPQTAWFTFSYSPIRDELGTVIAVLCICTETSDAVVARRRQSFLIELEAAFRGTENASAVVAAAQAALGRHFGVSRVGYGTVDDSQRYFTTEANWTDGSVPSHSGTHDLAAFGEEIFRSLQQGISLAVEDALLDPRAQEPTAAAAFSALEVRAAATVSLIKNGRFVAALYLHQPTPRKWAPADLSLIEEVAERTWSAVERAKAESELRALNQTLEARVTERTSERNRVWSMSRDLFAVMGFDGYLKAINPAWETTLGRDIATLLDLPFPDQVHPDDHASVAAVIEQLRAGETVERFADRLLHADGGWRWISWTLVPEGDVFYAVGRDVTAEKHREAELSARTAERDRLWTLSQDMFARANLEGMMSAVSPAWTRILGWSQEELLSRPYATFMHEEDMAPTLNALAGMGETGQPTRFENRISTRDGQWKWIEWTVAPELEGQNFIAVGRDLSGAKAREEELSVAQEALRQAQKMEAVGQLTGGIAHDFNNIIAGVSGSLELMSTRLAQGRLSEVERYLTAASGATRRAAAMTQRLLAFSRRQTLAPKPINLDGLVDGMLDLISRSVGPGIAVETVGKAGLWNTFADPGQLENALLNLCINARDAMPDGGKITIESANRWMDDRAAKERGLTPGQYVSLCVSDTGTGMAKEIIERAFDPFFTTKPLGQGTGLGLSMVHGFAGQSGGTVRIYSEPGQGTMVCIYLPRHAGDEAREDVEGAVIDAPVAVGGPVLMLVDDEPLIRMVAAEHLEDLGYTVLEAGDAKEALKAFDSNSSIALLITDVGLPGGMNGRQLAEAVRQTRPDLEVLFITGYAENAVFNHGHLERGMHMMGKPFQMDAFVAKVAELIRI